MLNDLFPETLPRKLTESFWDYSKIDYHKTHQVMPYFKVLDDNSAENQMSSFPFSQKWQSVKVKTTIVLLLRARIWEFQKLCCSLSKIMSIVQNEITIKRLRFSHN